MSEQRQKYRKAITIGVAVAVACALIATGFFIGSLGNDEAVTDGQRAILVDTCMATTDGWSQCAAFVERVIESGQEGGCDYREIALYVGAILYKRPKYEYGPNNEQKQAAALSALPCFRGTAITR